MSASCIITWWSVSHYTDRSEEKFYRESGVVEPRQRRSPMFYKPGRGRIFSGCRPLLMEGVSSLGMLDDMAPLGYRVAPGHRIEIEIQQANGARARVVSTIDSIPLAAG